ncbi:MAG: deoxyguanosinetriphosphate triphosphohydrolase [Planctomycetes bacterium]|nr:deoxyguanosinetriphosphate triphosphohydrolase [Planctomycetota bacterium]
MNADGAAFEPCDWLSREDDFLAPYAMRTGGSRGRKHAEVPHPYRTLYQRDRDRIVHSTAFRRLMHKTQVLVNQPGDYHRTRLTHTLEVAQIARTIARRLGLNEDLTEAVALLHDLGHPPFGHAGETALDEAMRAHGGYEHNRHGLRLVEFLEYRYPDFPGLNLSWEVLESQAMHSKRPEAPEVKPYLDVGQPLLEAQVVDASDSLAYDCHDVDDALSVGLITLDDLANEPFWQGALEQARTEHPRLKAEQLQPTVVRKLIDWQVVDLLETTSRNLHAEKIRAVEDVRRCPRLLVTPGAEVKRLKTGLEVFLHERVYRHYRVMRMAHKGQRILREMFEEFRSRPNSLPTRYRRRAEAVGLELTVCDYLAGMTDRFAQDEYLRLFQPASFV